MDDVFSNQATANPLIALAHARSDGSRESYLKILQDLIRDALDSGDPPDFWIIAKALQELTPDIAQTPSERLLRESRDER